MRNQETVHIMVRSTDRGPLFHDKLYTHYCTFNRQVQQLGSTFVLLEGCLAGLDSSHDMAEDLWQHEGTEAGDGQNQQRQDSSTWLDMRQRQVGLSRAE